MKTAIMFELHFYYWISYLKDITLRVLSDYEIKLSCYTLTQNKKKTFISSNECHITFTPH
jgi:hypothetical protein